MGHGKGATNSPAPHERTRSQTAGSRSPSKSRRRASASPLVGKPAMSPSVNPQSFDADAGVLELLFVAHAVSVVATLYLSFRGSAFQGDAWQLPMSVALAMSTFFAGGGRWLLQLIDVAHQKAL